MENFLSNKRHVLRRRSRAAQIRGGASGWRRREAFFRSAGSRMTIIGSHRRKRCGEGSRRPLPGRAWRRFLGERCAAGVCATEEESVWEKHGRLFSCACKRPPADSRVYFSGDPRRGTYSAALPDASGAPIFAVALYFSAILAGGLVCFSKSPLCGQETQARYEPFNDRGSLRGNWSWPMAGGGLSKFSFLPGASARIMECRQGKSGK